MGEGEGDAADDLPNYVWGIRTSGPVALGLILRELAQGFSFGLGLKLQLSDPSEDHMSLLGIYLNSAERRSMGWKDIGH